MLYNGDKLHLTVAPAVLTTSKLRILLGKGVKTDFGADQPCSVTINVEAMPYWDKHYDQVNVTNSYWILDMPISLDFKCLNENTPTTEFEQVTSL